MTTNLNAEYVNPFLEAANAVFKTVLKCDLRRGKLSIKDNPSPNADVSIIIGITGGVTGEVVYGMEFEMVNNVAKVLAPNLSEPATGSTVRMLERVAHGH